MDNETKRLLTQLLPWCAVTVAGPVMDLYQGNRFSFLILIGGFLLFPLSFVALAVYGWQGVRTGRLSRMEAWWWLSTPYSVALPLAVVALRLRKVEINFHNFGLALVAWLVTGLSSATWTLVTILRKTGSHPPEFTATNKLMLVLAVPVSIMAVFAFVASVIN
jgi:hypothetical protein